MERRVVNPLHHHVGRLAGAAARHNVHGLEHLHAGDKRGYQQEDGGGRQQRHRDMAEALHAVRAVYGRSLVIILGNALHGGQINHHAIARHAPEG